MAIADLDAYLDLLTNKQQIRTFNEDVTSTQFLCDSYATTQGQGPTPTTGVVPGRTDAGALGQQNGDSTALRVIEAGGIPTAGSTVNTGHGVHILCDRLSHSGGLVCNTTGEQTTNLPTAALTRYTSGVGVMCGLTVYTIGAMATGTITARYTMGGVGSKTTPTIAEPNGAVGVGRFLVLPAEAGGTGFQSVEGVTLSVAGSTAGNFGVTLFKPLAMFIVDRPQAYNLNGNPLTGGLVGALAEVLDDACLFILSCPLGTANANIFGWFHLGVE